MLRAIATSACAVARAFVFKASDKGSFALACTREVWTAFLYTIFFVPKCSELAHCRLKVWTEVCEGVKLVKSKEPTQRIMIEQGTSRCLWHQFLCGNGECVASKSY